jgi:hypothetical protein
MMCLPREVMIKKKGFKKKGSVGVLIPHASSDSTMIDMSAHPTIVKSNKSINLPSLDILLNHILH